MPIHPAQSLLEDMLMRIEAESRDLHGCCLLCLYVFPPFIRVFGQGVRDEP